MRTRSCLALTLALALGAGPSVAGCFDFLSNHGDGSSGDGEGGSGSTGSGPEVTGSLGTFDADAKITQTSCGVGALGMQNEWTFVVGLGRDEASGACTWDVGGGPVAGACDADHLSFDAKIVIDMREGDDGTHPACSIERHDIATAAIDDPDNPTHFTGTLSYTFTPTIGSNCADLYIGQAKQFLALPCQVQYAVTGKRRAAE